MLGYQITKNDKQADEIKLYVKRLILLSLRRKTRAEASNQPIFWDKTCFDRLDRQGLI